MNTEYLSLSIYILLVNFFLKIMFLFLKEVSYAHQACYSHLFDPKYSKKYKYCENFHFESTVHFILMYLWQINFQQSLLQSSVSHDPSEIILIWKISVLVNLHYKIIKIVGHFILRSNSCY